MIPLSDFIIAINNSLQRKITSDDNIDQCNGIRADIDQSLYIVAGPGSGKTMVMTLRILKIIYVDGVDPSTILATTFTKKAASELRSRILGWGDKLRESFIENSKYSAIREKIQKIDFNQIITGTLDSIAETILKDYRKPGSPPPVIIEDFIANATMMRFGLLRANRYQSQDLKDYLFELRGSKLGINIAEMASILIEIKDRCFHDMVDIDRYCELEKHPGVTVICDAIKAYQQALDDRLLYDFAKIEFEFYQKIMNGEVADFTEKIRFVLVDEYQDTNLLQEKIYFALGRCALKNGGSITVVGDDDQSIYRFRGATVDLFTDFPSRIKDRLGVQPKKITLSKNYRSTSNIVKLASGFITLDTAFQNVRVLDKPTMQPTRIGEYENYPVLGIFRDDVETLAQDLSVFIGEMAYGDGVTITSNGVSYTIKFGEGGSPGDICFLLSSPQEINSNGGLRLPGRIRKSLENRTNPIKVFNPRGQKLPVVPEVQLLCGLMLECIDPEGNVQNSITSMPREANEAFFNWRQSAQTFVQNHQEKKGSLTLKQYLQAWQNRSPINKTKWPNEVPLLDLLYKLITWLPTIQDDVEGLVYLEVVTRTITQSAVFNSFESELIFNKNNPDIEKKSIKDAYRGIFIPLATGAIDINEDLLETVPRDRIPIMSIHQAKGLEYPLVIVDVGSDFKTDHHFQYFKRFPSDGGKTCRLEDLLRKYSELGSPTRTDKGRAFDDLIRQYFVAFSRPQDVLLLVGLNSVKNGYHTKGKKSKRKFIPNVSTGWDRTERWHWGEGLPNIYHYEGVNQWRFQ